MKRNPGISICRSFFFKVASNGFTASVTLKRKMMEAAASAPQGRSIKLPTIKTTYYTSTYHQRHDTRSVRAPPINGPMTNAMAYSEPINPVIAGLFSGGAETPIMIYDAPNVPATPKFVIARPISINVMLFLATPDTISKL